MTWKQTWALAGAAVVFGACRGAKAPAADGDVWTSVADTVADTVIVRTLSGSVWPDTVTLEPEVSIGVVDGELEYIIGNPTSMAVDAGGTVYVLDGQVPVVRAYGPDGIHRFDVGGEGNGPGEYDSPDAIALLSDGKLLVKDPANNRITVYASADGDYLGEWSYPGNFNTNRRYYVDREDRSHATLLLVSGAPWDWEFGLERRDVDGRIVDTLAAPVWRFDRAQVRASGEGSSSVRPVPFTAQTWWSFSPLGYFVGGVSLDYRVEVFRPGEPVLRIERAWTPVPVQGAEADEERGRIVENFIRQYGSWRWNGPPIPDAKPPFKGGFVSEEGDIWVELSTEGEAIMSVADARAEEHATGSRPRRFREPPAFDVFTPDGRYLGHVRPPPDLRTDPDPIVRGDVVWAVTRDELDVARIVRFRMVR